MHTVKWERKKKKIAIDLMKQKLHNLFQWQSMRMHEKMCEAYTSADWNVCAVCTPMRRTFAWVLYDQVDRMLLDVFLLLCCRCDLRRILLSRISSINCDDKCWRTINRNEHTINDRLSSLATNYFLIIAFTEERIASRGNRHEYRLWVARENVSHDIESCYGNAIRKWKFVE